MEEFKDSYKDSYFLSNLFNAFSPVSSNIISSSNPPSIKLIYNKEVENYRNEFIHKERIIEIAETYQPQKVK